MTDSTVARCTAFVGHHEGSAVLYRHSRTTETFIAKPGESLPRRKGEGCWYPLTADNIETAKRCPILIGSGLMWATEGAMLKVGDEINLMFTGDPRLVHADTKHVGCFRVTWARHTRTNGQNGVHIEADYIGEMDPTKLIHLAKLFSC